MGVFLDWVSRIRCLWERLSVSCDDQPWRLRLPWPTWACRDSCRFGGKRPCRRGAGYRSITYYLGYHILALQPSDGLPPSSNLAGQPHGRLEDHLCQFCSPSAQNDWSSAGYQAGGSLAPAQDCTSPLASSTPSSGFDWCWHPNPIYLILLFDTA